MWIPGSGSGSKRDGSATLKKTILKNAYISHFPGIMGLHSMMNQDQYHASQSSKVPRADPEVGWNGVTKATPLKAYPDEAPNQTKPEDVVKKLQG